ncbi:hypothetical protein EWH70_04505 [Amycolatopsis suaedae]|uniref:Uncharacterized protein n=1 Tax=Amycolatopsis suaedae TaxID=2510978 RepID=A0A4Q7JCU8_9PSEU|nr:hypothetical protein EWH70_04505 [Amycolatopsis suaedae]
MDFALVIGLVLVIFLVAGIVVVSQDRRAARQAALRRQERLARLGEVDPLAVRDGQPDRRPR